MAKIRTLVSWIALVLFSTIVYGQPIQAQSMSKYSLDTQAPDAQLTKPDDEKISLSNLFERKRIILLFVPSAYDSAAGKYLSDLKVKESSLVERDVTVFAVVATESSLLKDTYGPNITVVSACDPMPTSMSPNFDNGPLFVLIGKDKTIKLSEPNFVDIKAFCNVIDAMPMRRAEIKEKKAK